MAQVHKTLGRGVPTAGANLAIYTAPSGKTAICSCITVTNTDDVTAADDLVRVHFVPSGGSANKTNPIIFDLVVSYGDPFVANLAHDLMPGDALVVYSRDGHCAFLASGLEIG